MYNISGIIPIPEEKRRNSRTNKNIASAGYGGSSAHRLIYGDYGNGTVVVTLNRNTPDVPSEIYSGRRSGGTEEDGGVASLIVVLENPDAGVVSRAPRN